MGELEKRIIRDAAGSLDGGLVEIGAMQVMVLAGLLHGEPRAAWRTGQPGTPALT